MRNLTVSIFLALGLAGSAFADNTAATPASVTPAPAVTAAAPDTAAQPAAHSAAQPAAEGSVQPATAAQQTLTPVTSADPNRGFSAELSIPNMFYGADVVVKSVMIGLVLASVITWALLFSKGFELTRARRRLRREVLQLKDARTLDDACAVTSAFSEHSMARILVEDAVKERTLSEKSDDISGTKDRVAFRQERIVAGEVRLMGRGNGYLATIGAISPFVGLFGTVWGIMNSFIGIAHSQTTNLAVVAPGIAEALLATALGLVAAIPAVVIYNVFARMINSYRGDLNDTAALAILWLGRDLDLAKSNTR